MQKRVEFLNILIIIIKTIMANQQAAVAPLITFESFLDRNQKEPLKDDDQKSSRSSAY